MNDGETFKFLRTSRGISQKDIVKNNLSRTTISKFENTKIMLSMTNFNYLLNSIDISLEEFNFIKNNYAYDDKEQLIYLFNKLFLSIEHTKINNLIELCDNYLLDNFSKSIKCIRHTLYVMKYIDTSDNPLHKEKMKKHTAEIWKELSEIDNWTMLDIKIINCCIHFFEPDTYLLLSDQLVHSLEKYKNFANIILLETSIYLNLTFLFLIEKNIDKAKYFSVKAKDSAFKSKRIDYIALSLVRYGIVFKEKDSLDKGIGMIAFLEDETMINAINKEIKKFKLEEF